MAEITQAQIDAIDKERPSIAFGGVDLGAFLPDSVGVTVNEVTQELRIDQVPGIVKEWQEGWDISISVTLMDVSPDFVRGVLLKNRLATRFADSGNPFVGFGNRKIDKASSSVAETLRIHGYGVDQDNRQLDWYFWKTAGTVQGEIPYGATRVKQLQVVFKIYPDFTKNIDFQYGGYGDWAGYSEDAAPDAVSIVLGNSQVPQKTNLGVDIAVGEIQNISAYGYWSTNGEAGALNGAIASATATTFDVDGFGTGVFPVAGDYIRVNSETMYVTGVSGSTLTVVRGVWNNGAATHLDNDVVTILANVNSADVTRFATWASGTPATATVGNLFDSPTNTSRKGVVKGIAAGTTNVTATIGAVASQNCVVTVA